LQHKHSLVVQVVNTFITEKKPQTTPDIEIVSSLIKASPSMEMVEKIQRAIASIRKTELPF
jgi:hypothetical protein